MMKTILQKVRLLMQLLLLLTVAAAMAQQPKASGIKKGMVKVKFTPAMTATLSQLRVATTSKGLTTGHSSIDRVAKATKAKNMTRLFPYDARFENKLRKHGLHLWYVIEMDESVDPKTVVTQFKQLTEVETAEVEHEKIIAPFTVTPYTPSATTFDAQPFNDPMLKDQWHYNNTSQMGFGDADVNLFQAWTKTSGASNIIVSVHDQGVDINHKDLQQNIWVNLAEKNGQANVDDDGNGYVDDINGWNFKTKNGKLDAEYHGTHVAGTIAAVNNNGVGVSGIAGGNGTGNGVKIMSLEILGGAAIEKSYVYAANNGAVISQNSWGYTSPYYYDQSVHDAIDYFIEEAGDYPGSPMKGGLVIFAAGNSNSSEQWYPGYYPHVFSVASLGPEWIRAPYSNYGDWVELAAPGGDQENYGGKGGVLSTIPKDQYAYMQGTSMACPHVSGIAALALANRTKQLTAQELWNKLVTGTVNIDSYNPDFVGTLGSGAIDASLAIQNDSGIAPNKINDLAITGIAQEFATLTWTVPGDEDDLKPVAFQLYYHTQPITANNLSQATLVTIKNANEAGSTTSYEVQNLLGLTTYYFAIIAVDRWGNASALSNIEQGTTNQGPSIAVDENSQEINLNIDVNDGTSASHAITILNNAEGILRWDHFTRHKNTSLAFNAAGLHYPKVSLPKSTPNVSRAHALDKAKSKSVEAQPASFQSQEIAYTNYATNIIGETDLTLTNSAAAKFYVSQAEGFNLTQARMYLKHDPALGPVIMEVYQGASPVKANLIYAQEYSSWSKDETWASITLDEQLYFPQGTTFWLAFHIPAGNLFPLGIGYEIEPQYSAYCYISFDLGNKWAPLEQVIDSEDFAWSVVAASYNEHLGNYLTLEPGSGDVAGLEQTATTLTANAETLINGDYSANLVITSNDAQKKELRIPVNLNVTGQKPDIRHIDIAEFGNTFVGTENTLELTLDNQGFGNFNNPEFNISGDQFVIDGYAPWQIKAREQVTVRIKFKPTRTGNINDLLTISNGTLTYEIPLFGIGAETATIVVSPSTQTIDNIGIGDAVQAELTVQNTGAYPLKYFIPGFDTKGVSNNWPTKYHKYGYKFRTNYETEANPIAYAFQDISSTGVDITQELNSDDKYATVDMGFAFPYYGTTQDKIYIAQKGFTTFDNSVRPINTPNIPGNEWTPAGYISLLGTHLSYIAQGKIYYQLEADRMIIQYDNVTDGWSGSATAQMVLFANGNIRFFYENLEIPAEYLSVLMEDVAKQDGILIDNYNKVIDMYNGLALGFDYPGPNIISSMVNGSGIVMPGNSASVTVNLNTSTLVEGTTNRYINFISNDPAHGESYSLIQLNITHGGVAKPMLSTDTIAFGNVFQGATRSVPVIIKNQGTADVNIASMVFVNDAFNLMGDQPTVIQSGLYKKYSIAIPTTSLGSFEDWLSINYADGTHDTIYVTGAVVVPPAINVDLSLLQETLTYGQISSHPFTIQNPGQANLEVSATGAQWLSFEADEAATDFTYSVEKHNDGSFYQWLDIRKSGTQLPFVDFENFEETFWRELELPFPIQFYGVAYSKLKIGDNGIISFENEPQTSFFTDYIPSQMHTGPCIMPYWTFSGFTDVIYPKENIGIFYQFYDDKVVILYSYFTNNFGGMGDPVSAEIILYKNGTMKFQYKAEEGGADATSNFSTIGLQKDSNTGIAISQYLPLDYGSGGLAYMIVPANKLTIAPGATLSGNIKLDATNIYGGVYSADLKIETNVPNQEHLGKPVELTVEGEAALVAETEIDFGTKMIAYDQFGTPLANYKESQIANDGSAPLEISWMQMADGTQGLSLQVWALVDGWFGPEWRWADISELYSPWAWQTPVFKLNPGDVLKVRAAFTPQQSGSFADDVVLTTSISENRITLKGTGVEPPVLEVDTTPIDVMANSTTESTTKTIAFNNNNGHSNLDYEVSIDYGRASTSSLESVGTTASGKLNLIATRSAASVNQAVALSTYDRVISHTEKTTPDTFIGTGGASPFTLATQYNAGPEGFNLSHVETFFRTETLASGTVQVEIRAGGTSIANAAVVAQGTLNFTGSGADETGSWYQIAMDKATQIFPNENFYVAITYPLGIQYPQGSFFNSPKVSNRYLYFDEGLWYNLQDVSDFSETGWLMYAGQTTTVTGTWLTITSSNTGTLEAGESSSIELKFDAAYAERGDQIANIVIKSNDPNSSTVTVAVKLHLNEGPHFNYTETVTMAENETKVISIPVSDPEENSFTVAAMQTYADVSAQFADGVLTIELTPDFGDAGNYQYTFKATDQYNAVGEFTLAVDVIKTNRAPVFIGTTDELVYNVSDKIKEFDLGDFFSDPDDDNLSYTVTNADESVVLVYASTSKFLIQPMAAGETALNFAVTDSQGATLNKTITAKVNVVLGTEPSANLLEAFPNPASDIIIIKLPSHWKGNGQLNMQDISGKEVFKSFVNDANQSGSAINLNGLATGTYLLRASNGKEVFIQRIIKK